MKFFNRCSDFGKQVLLGCYGLSKVRMSLRNMIRATPDILRCVAKYHGPALFNVTKGGQWVSYRMLSETFLGVVYVTMGTLPSTSVPVYMCVLPLCNTASSPGV